MEARGPNLKRTGRRSFAAVDSALDVLGVAITNPGRRLFAEASVTKASLASHYVSYMDRLLPLLAGRPLGLMRCPTGRESQTVFDRGPSARLMQTTRRGALTDRIIIVKTPQDVIALVERGTVEIHAGNVRTDRPNMADRVIFELDPAEDLPFSITAEALTLVRNGLLERGLEAFVFSTGGRGYAVMVPLERRLSVVDAFSWSKAFAATVAVSAPRHLTVNTSKASRRDRVFLNTAWNAPGSLSIAPYSSRMRAGAPLALPLPWDAVLQQTRPALHHVGEAPAPDDPWAHRVHVRQRLGQRQHANLDGGGRR